MKVLSERVSRWFARPAAVLTRTAERRFEQRFREACRRFEAPSMLELGTKQSVTGPLTMHRDWVPRGGEFLGTDIEAGHCR